MGWLIAYLVVGFFLGIVAGSFAIYSKENLLVVVIWFLMMFVFWFPILGIALGKFWAEWEKGAK